MSKVIAGIVVVGLLLIGGIEMGRYIPENLPVFVSPLAMIDKDEKYFHSFFYAYDFAKKYNTYFEYMKISDARKNGLKMADEFKKNYPLCFHSGLRWLLIEGGILDSDCAWTPKGQWKTPSGLVGYDDLVAHEKKR